MERVMQGLPVVTGPAWSGVNYFCTTRVGGVGLAPRDTLNLGRRVGDDPDTVTENRRRLRAALPAEPLWLRQVHGSGVVDADSAGLDDEPARDASVTAQPGRVLAVMVADCLPVVIAGMDGRVLGTAHAGWRGLSSGVLEHTLAAMRAKAPQVTAWRAWIGPGIGPEAFEVGRDVRDTFLADDSAADRYFQPRPGMPGKWLADLPGLAQCRLRRAGVQEVILSGLCTVADARRFFSYRRDGETGRMALLAWLDSD